MSTREWRDGRLPRIVDTRVHSERLYAHGIQTLRIEASPQQHNLETGFKHEIRIKNETEPRKNARGYKKEAEKVFCPPTRPGSTSDAMGRGVVAAGDRGRGAVTNYDTL